jgi:RNA polymerase sigma factor (sigma-70 family)
LAMSEFDHDHNDNPGVSRRRVLECMTWAGTGVLWTISGGVPRSLGLVGSAQAAEPAGMTFLQISDSHVGFDKPANPNALGTLEEAINKINAMPVKPSFMIHTGDITHLSKAAEFDNADRIISQAKLDVHYVPGEHDFLDEEVKFYRERYGRGAKGAGWYSFDASGVHFIGLVNVVDLKAGGLGNLGAEQLEWLEADLKGRSKSTPIVVFARRASSPTDTIEDVADNAGQTPLWHEAQETPEAQMLRRRDATTIRRIVTALAEPFRETFVLREIHNLSYREIADVVEAPVGTVMSRLARARAMLRSAWMAEEEQPK